VRGKRVDIFKRNSEKDRVPIDKEKEYVLGTQDDEIARLGMQHRVWRLRALVRARIVSEEFRPRESAPHSLIVTPLVNEIVAVRR
jgi:hypothetical protein